MGDVKDNTGKWYVFADGDVLWAEQTTGSDLNVDLQKNIADEIDSTINLTVGNCILGTESFRITPGAGNNAVNISSGYAIINGQRCRMANDLSVQNLSFPATHTFYLELDNDNDVYDPTTGSWPTKITRLTSGNPSGTYLRLGSVAVTANEAVQPSALTDNRVMHETHEMIANNINDNIIPEKNARSIRRRFGMMANRIKEIIGADGVQDWKDPIPGAGSGSLTGLWNKFKNTTGHAHSGSANDGGAISAINVVSTTTSGITATNVQGAIEQLDNKKLALNGSQPMTGLLTLSGNPTAPFHAATKQYVDQAVRMKQLIVGTIPSGKTVNYGTAASMLASQISITTSGGILKFEAGTGVIAAPQESPSYPWTPQVHFYLYKNNVEIGEQTVEILANPPFEVSPQFIFIPIPVFYDSPGNGTFSYDLRWNFTVPSHPTPTLTYNLCTGRLAGDTAAYWYVIEQ